MESNKNELQGKEWNRNEWQGRRKDQVDFSHLSAGVSIILLLITLLLVFLTS